MAYSLWFGFACGVLLAGFVAWVIFVKQFQRPRW